MNKRLRKKVGKSEFKYSFPKRADQRMRKKNRRKAYQTIRYEVIPMGEEDGAELKRLYDDRFGPPQSQTHWFLEQYVHLPNTAGVAVTPCAQDGSATDYGALYVFSCEWKTPSIVKFNQAYEEIKLELLEGRFTSGDGYWVGNNEEES